MGEFRALAVNQATLRLFNVDSLPALFEALAIQVAEVELPAALDMLLAVAERQQAFEADIPRYPIGDRVYDLHMRWIVLPGHEHDLSRMIISLEDITARRQAERDRLSLELERERSGLLRRFVGDVSHDLVTPITVLKTTLYLLSRTTSPDRQHERLRLVETQVDNLERMIENLLTMLRLDRVPEDDFDFVVQDLNPVVAGLVAAYQPLAENHRQTLEFVPGGRALPVRVDSDQFKRAVVNLLDNALKFTPAHGRIQVSVAAGADEAIIEVRDTGPGISADELKHIFERFYRGAQHRPIGSGMGLGLAIARRIVEAHNGRIEAESVVGQGAVLRIRLPLTAD